MADSDCVLKLKVLRLNTQKGEFDERIFKNAIERALGGKTKSVEWAILADKLAPKKKRAKKSKAAEEEEESGNVEKGKMEEKEDEEEEEEEEEVKAYNVAVKFVNKDETDKMRTHIEKGKGVMGCKLEILEMNEEEIETFCTKCRTSMKKAKVNSKRIRAETKEIEEESLKKCSKQIEAQREMIFGARKKAKKALPVKKVKGKKPKRK